MNSIFRLQAIVDLVDNFSRPLGRVISGVQRLQAQSAQADAAMQLVGSGLAVAGASMAAVAVPLGAATAAAIQFESAFADVKKVVDFPTPQAARVLADDLLKLSTQIAIPAAGLTDIAAAAGQAGIAMNELVGFTADAARTAVAFDISAMQAGDSIAKLRNVLQLSQPQVMGVVDSINHLSNAMASTAPDLLNVLMRVGVQGRQFGLTGQQTAALASAMLSLGTAPEVVATGLGALFNKLRTATLQGKDFQEGLARIGYSAGGLEAAIRKDAVGGLTQFLETVSRTSEPAKVLTQLFGLEYGDDIERLVGSMHLVRQGLGLVGDAAKYAGSTNAEFANRSATTANQLELLKNRLNALGITIGNFVLAPLNRAIDAAGRWLEHVRNAINLNPELAKTLGGIAIGIAALVGVIGLTIAGLGALGTLVHNTQIGLGFLQQALAAAQRQWRLFNLGLAWTRVLIATLGGPIPALRVAIATLTVSVRAFTAALLTNPVVWLVAGVVALGAAFVAAWRSSTKFRDSVRDALAPVAQAWAGLVAQAQALIAAFEPLKRAFVSIGQAMEAAFGKSNSALQLFARAFMFALGFLYGAVEWTFVTIAKIALNAISGVVQVVRGFVDVLVGLFTGDLDRARQGASAIWGGIRLMLAEPLRLAAVVWDSLRASLAAALSWSRGLWLQFVEVGANLMRGLAQGIVDLAMAPVNAIANVARSIAERVRSVLDINSPSRVMFDMGAMVSLGMAGGIASEMGAVQRSASTLTATATPAIAGTSAALHRAAQVAQIKPPKMPITTPRPDVGSNQQPPVGGTSIHVDKIELSLPNLSRADQAGEFLDELRALLEAYRN